MSARVQCGAEGCTEAVAWPSIMPAARARCAQHTAASAVEEPLREQWWKRRVPVPMQGAQISAQNPQVEEAARKFVADDHRGVVLMGPSYIGKTTMAYALAREMVERDAVDPRKMVVGREWEIFEEVYRAKYDGDRAAARRRVMPPASVDLLLIDDLGFGPARPELRRDLLTDLFDHLLVKARSTRLIVTTNWAPNEMNQALGAAAMNRLMKITSRRMWVPGSLNFGNGREYTNAEMAPFPGYGR